jgi:O-antigen/teichoic acid export membrane protein
VVPGVLFAVFSAPIMALYGPSFRQGPIILAILSLSALAVAINTVLGNALIGLGRIWQRCWMDYLLAATLAALAWWLIPLKGAVGLAIASAAAYSITSAVLGLHFWRASRART